MRDKQIMPAPAVEIESLDPAERQRSADRQGDHRLEPLDKSGNDSTQDSAEYIAVLASQLQRIAETNGHEFLTYLFDMVVVEAWRIAGPDAENRDNKGNSASSGRV